MAATAAAARNRREAQEAREAWAAADSAGEGPAVVILAADPVAEGAVASVADSVWATEESAAARAVAGMAPG